MFYNVICTISHSWHRSSTGNILLTNLCTVGTCQHSSNKKLMKTAVWTCEWARIQKITTVLRASLADELGMKFHRQEHENRQKGNQQENRETQMHSSATSLYKKGHKRLVDIVFPSDLYFWQTRVDDKKCAWGKMMWPAWRKCHRCVEPEKGTCKPNAHVGGWEWECALQVRAARFPLATHDYTENIALTTTSTRSTLFWIGTNQVTCPKLANDTY